METLDGIACPLPFNLTMMGLGLYASFKHHLNELLEFKHNNRIRLQRGEAMKQSIAFRYKPNTQFINIYIYSISKKFHTLTMLKLMDLEILK